MIVFLIFFSFASSCLDNAQCRSNDDCGAVCNKTSGVCLKNSIPLVCLENEVCQETKGSCFKKCVIDSDCRPNSVCEKKSGKCLGCIYDADCYFLFPKYCGWKCSTTTNECYNGNICPSGQSCIFNTSTYTCISRGSMQKSGISMILFVSILLSLSFL